MCMYISNKFRRPCTPGLRPRTKPPCRFQCQLYLAEALNIDTFPSRDSRPNPYVSGVSGVFLTADVAPVAGALGLLGAKG